MKKWALGAVFSLCVAVFFCISCAAQGTGNDYSTLPEQYVALEQYIPAELGALLPDGLFSSDAE